MSLCGSSIPKAKWIIYTDAAQKEDHRRPNEDAQKANLPLAKATVSFRKSTICHLCELDDAERVEVLRCLQDQVYYGATRDLLWSDLLFCVTQFNIIGAMCKNAASLGLTMKLLHMDILSQFNILQPDSCCPLPPALQPTKIQREVIHHPWIDLFPVPSIRDALLRMIGRYEKAEICQDFFGECGGKTGSVGLLVWGEAWDPSAYEVSEWFVDKWGWIMKECPDIIQSTNYWRASRGEPPLRLMPG
jgi:hypothetical protein